MSCWNKFKYRQQSNDVEKSYISCTMLQRFFLLVMLCVLFVFSNVAQGALKTLSQLTTKLEDAKSVTEELDAKIELIDFYAQVDPRKWKTSIAQLKAKRKRYPTKESQEKIDLIVAEFLLK